MIKEENTSTRGKTAVKAGTAYVVSNIAVKAVVFITTPVFVRMMTTEEYGTVSLFVSWSSLLIYFSTLRLDASVGRAKLDFPDKIKEYVGSIQLLSAIVSLILSLIMLLSINSLHNFFELTVIETAILVVYISAQPAINFHQSLYKYRYQYKQNIFIAWYTIIGTTVLSYILMSLKKVNADLYRIVGLTVPSLFLSIYYWAKEFLGHNLHLDKSFWIYGIKISGPLVIHEISLYILSQSDRIFISKLCSVSDVGIYSLAYTIGLALSIITNSISEAWLPWFHDTYYENKTEDIRNKVKPIIILGMYIGLATVALAPEGVLIMGGKKYLSGIICVAPVTLGIVARFIYTHYVNIELHLKKTIYVSIGTVIAAVLNIILNWIFIPKFGFVAAAYTTLASYIVLLFMHYLITRFLLNVSIYDDLFMFCAGLITIVVSVALTFTYKYTLMRYSLICIGFISFIIYFRSYISVGLIRIRNYYRNKKAYYK